MKAGRVVTLRVNPRDCMSVVAVLEKLEINTPGMSFAQAVSLALSSALEAFRQNNVLPKEDTFNFNKVMDRFPPENPKYRQGIRARKLEVTEAIGLRGAPSLIPETPERKRRKLRLDELRFRVENDSQNMSDEEMVEYSELSNEFTPL